MNCMSSMLSRGTSGIQDANELHSTSNPVSPLTADIPCNDRGTDYKTLSNQALAHILAEVVKFDETEIDTSIMVDNWQSLGYKKNVNIYFKIDKYTKQRVMMGMTTVKCDIEDAVDYILDHNTRFKYDNTVKEHFELEKFDKEITFSYISMQTKACALNYYLDICYLSAYREVCNKHVIAYSSILDSPYAPSMAHIKRGWLFHSGFILEKCEDDEESIKITYILHCDLRIDELPHTLKNIVLEKQILSLAYLRNELQREQSRVGRFRSSLSLDENPFPIERIPSNQSIDMNLSLESASVANGMPYSGPMRRTMCRTYSDQSAPLCINRDLESLTLDQGSYPDLCFWSLDDNTEALKDDSLECLSDYITMGNSAAASLYREYINVLEAVRFSAVCPEKLSWKVVEKNDEVWTLEKIGSTIQCMAGVANIRATEREITDFLIDPRSRFSYDPTLNKTYVVDDINKDLRVIYAHHKAKHCFIGHGRDLLYFAYLRKEGDKRIIAHASCTHPKCPVNPDIIRSTMYETGFIIEPLPEADMSSIVYIVKVDFGGNIPNGLLKWVTKRQPQVLFEIKKYFER